MKPEDIDRLYQESFEGFEAEVSDQAWNRLNRELPQKSKKKYFFLLFLFLILLRVISITYWGLSMSHSSNQSTSVVANTDTAHSSQSLLNYPNLKIIKLDSTHVHTQSSLPLNRSSITISHNFSPLPQTLSEQISTTPQSDQTNTENGITTEYYTGFKLLPTFYKLSAVSSNFTLPVYEFGKPSVPSSEQPGNVEAISTISRTRKIFIELTPFYSFQHIHPNLMDEQITTFPNSAPTFSPKRIGIQFATGIYQPLGNKFYLRMGINSTYLNQPIAFDQTFFEGYEVLSGENLFSGVRLAPLFNTLPNNQINLQVWDLGLTKAIGYMIGPQTRSGRIEIGANIHFPIQERALKQMERNDIYTQGKISTMIYLSGKWPMLNLEKGQVSFGPQFSYSINHWEFQDAPFSLRAYRVGATLQYQFN